MPRADASASILSASAGYQAGDWDAVQGGGLLDFRAEAELERGVNLEFGAETLVSLDATLSKFLSVDLQGQATVWLSGCEYRSADDTPCGASPAYTIQTLYELPRLLRRLRAIR